MNNYINNLNRVIDIEVKSRQYAENFDILADSEIGSQKL